VQREESGTVVVAHVSPARDYKLTAAAVQREESGTVVVAHVSPARDYKLTAAAVQREESGTVVVAHVSPARDYKLTAAAVQREESGTVVVAHVMSCCAVMHVAKTCAGENYGWGFRTKLASCVCAISGLREAAVSVP
jgi:hypothetical protein